MKEIFKTDIIGYGYDGEGVGRLDNKVAFLPFALEGESVEFLATEEKSKFVRGKVLSIGNSNRNRCEPQCPYYQQCGGCTLQHANYEYQLDIKRQLVAHQMKKVGYLGNIEVVPSLKEYGYRNKIRLFVGEKGVALKERASNKLVYIKKCLLVCERINDAIDKIDNFIKLQNLQKVYSEIVIRNEENKLLINFIVNKPVNINYQGLYLLLGNCGIYETYKHDSYHKIGLQKLEVEEMGLFCEFSIKSFHQVNKYLTENLYQCVIENIKGKHVLNCYSGAGVLSGVIAKQNKIVFGIELGISEHQDAEKLKKSNNLVNLTNICGDCAEVLTKFSKDADTIIIDPPRAGVAESVCEALDKTDCQRLIYVSCNSATLVRDIGRLNSFEIEKVYLFDMFAQTGEYEVLCVLNKKSDI